MSSKMALARLNKELKRTLQEPDPLVAGVRPASDNLFEIHFVLHGPPNSPYADGQYWGRFVMPPNYPDAPPDLYMFTPSGRFETGKKICTSFTAYHPESWNPLWTLNTLLQGVLSFMGEESSTAGSVHNFSWSDRRLMAAASWEANAKSAAFRALFPELCDAARATQARTLVTQELRAEGMRMALYTGAAIAALLVFVAYKILWA